MNKALLNLKAKIEAGRAKRFKMTAAPVSAQKPVMFDGPIGDGTHPAEPAAAETPEAPVVAEVPETPVASNEVAEPAEAAEPAEVAEAGEDSKAVEALAVEASEEPKAEPEAKPKKKYYKKKSE